MPPYAILPSLTFDSIPGALPPDLIPQDLDLSPFPALATSFLQNLGSSSTLTPSALWRDFFILTGRVLTFYSSSTISREWSARTEEKDFRVIEVKEVQVSRLTPTTSWVDVVFSFKVGREEGEELEGGGFGILSFVPAEEEEGEWKVWMVRTMLENFDVYGHPDDPSPIFKTPSPLGITSSAQDYEVVVIGAGQSGLSLSGRLGALGIRYLLLEKEAEIGYSWTGKYDSVRQHTVKEMNNLPFARTYEESDPILLPAKAVARGFRRYVEKYRINIWLSATTEKCDRRKDGGWELCIKVGEERRVLNAKHLVLSMGAGVSVPNPPDFPSKEGFKGDVLNIGSYKNSHKWKGKKGIVVGSGTGAHDVAQDMLDAGLSSITMIQRGKTPVFPVEWIVQGQSTVYNTDIPPPLADRLVSLLPLKIERELMEVNLGGAAAAESARFDDLEKSGFQVDRKAVLTDLLLLRGGGYYIDVGTSKRITDGDIKVKSGVGITEFSEKGLKFDDGEEIEADLVVFATGYQRDARIQAASIVGEDIAGALPHFRGLDEGSEIRGNMRPSAEGLWLMGGAVSDARFQSRFVALQIQAELLGKPLPDCRWGEHKSS